MIRFKILPFIPLRQWLYIPKQDVRTFPILSIVMFQGPGNGAVVYRKYSIGQVMSKFNALTPQHPGLLPPRSLNIIIMPAG